MTRYGQFMYKLCDSGADYLKKHKALYYILACTNGLIMTLLGAIITLALLLIGKKPIKYKRVYYFKVGKKWGGFEMGLMFVQDQSDSERLRSHEYGHTFQNALLGPLFPLLVAIPSALRYWYREFIHKYNNEKYKTLPAYDAIWFEKNATDIGMDW